MAKIIGVCGFAQTGKSTVGDLLVEHHGASVLSIGAMLNDLAVMINPKVSCKSRYADYVSERGYEGAKAAHPEIRDFLIRLGDALRSGLGEDVLIQAMLENARGLVVITNVRHDNEFAMIKQMGGEMWRVTRPGVGPARDHPTETSHPAWQVDAELHNDSSIEELGRVVDQLMAQQSRV